ncbi:MAG: hypothetical protein COX57_07045 [Alphaproteobacteria bacterium CG_4_10_14_0_2_um_filter_63_37]|nr:MAG: hypothetical protein AUJ55_04300 [Proteobacteria bacterium CG1_02_64_396]PJA24749.1 MAG: hypothetical protein COX57_07045 [Alphaproteobacteria bacterium CG_4_10_14_0_2_um_filter_63_37]
MGGDPVAEALLILNAMPLIGVSLRGGPWGQRAVRWRLKKWFGRAFAITWGTGDAGDAPIPVAQHENPTFQHKVTMSPLDLTRLFEPFDTMS